MKKSLIISIALLLLCSTALCSCDVFYSAIEGLVSMDRIETPPTEKKEPSYEADAQEPSEDLEDSVDSEDTSKDFENKPSQVPDANDPSEEATRGEELEPVSVRITYSDFGMAYTAYSADGRIAGQTYLSDAMQYEENIYCRYFYDKAQRLVGLKIYSNQDGYALYEWYSLEVVYEGNSKTVSSAKYYEDGELAREAAKVEYHENGALALIWLGDDDNCEMMFSFDDLGRFINCAHDQEWGSHVMIYGEGENPEKVAFYSAFDASFQGYADLTYAEDGCLEKIYVSQDSVVTEGNFEYENRVIVKCTYKYFYEEQNRTMVTTASAKLDEYSRIIARNTARYESDVCALKTEETFKYDENGRVVEKEIKNYTDETTLKSKRVSLWEYDAEGRIVKQEYIDYDGQNQLTERRIFERTYDDKGQLTMAKTTCYKADGTVDVSGTYFTYDEQGNLVDIQSVK